MPDVSREGMLPVLASRGDLGVRTSFAGAINPFEAEGNVRTVHEGYVHFEAPGLASFVGTHLR